MANGGTAANGGPAAGPRPPTVPRHRQRRATMPDARQPGPHRPAREPRRGGASLLRLRHWRVRTKLVAVLVIPAVAFLVASGVNTSLSVRQASGLSALAEQVALGRPVTALVHELQYERDRLGGELAAVLTAPASARDQDRLADTRTAAQASVAPARAAFEAAAAPLHEQPALAAPIAEATEALDELAAVHTGLEQGWLRQQAVFDGYTRAIDALLALLRAPSAGAALPVAVDADLRAYQDLAEVKEVSAQIRAQVYAMASAGRVAAGEPEQLADARARRGAALERFRTDATAGQLAQFDAVMRGQAVLGSARLEQVVLEQAASGVLDVDPEQWWSAATTELELMREVESALLSDAQQRVSASSSGQWRLTAVVTGATVLILLVSLLASVGIGRSMARSLRRLREQAIDVAQAQLPGLLARLRAARGAVPAVAEVPPVAAGGADEVGEVADAFTQVHRSAVALAVEQATMRHNVNAIFVNLARRSQVLVERQLELLDDLERDETEPAQLHSLFRLDHLATRMRRNNESLLVLTDSDASLLYHRPVPLSAVTVAAIAEIEQYERVREDVAAGLHVVGRAVADLVHLLAELLDNATSFSARETTVAITGRGLSDPDGVLVEVTDFGLGMTPAALHEANAQLATPPAIDVAASERMGLVVVSHLAARHGIRVQLATTRWGVRASVWLPAALLSAPPADPQPEPVLAPVAGGRRAMRAEDVLAGTDQDSAWWSREGGQRAGGGTATRLPPAPVPTVAGTSAGGLPIRVPLAQLPNVGPKRPDRVPAWRAGDLDPDDVGGTLSRFYGGIRRAEAEDDDIVAEPAGSASGEPEQGST